MVLRGPKKDRRAFVGWRWDVDRKDGVSFWVVWVRVARPSGRFGRIASAWDRVAVLHVHKSMRLSRSEVWRRCVRKKAMSHEDEGVNEMEGIHGETNQGLKKVLDWKDLTMLGIGGIIGAGVFVLTGVAAESKAGPAVAISYTLASVASLFSALCYSEFASEFPIAGGAFNYVAMTFGELLAWIVGCNLILEYTLSAAAIARGFSSYLSTLFGMHPTALITNLGPIPLDFTALLVIGLLCAILAYGIEESSKFNMVITGLNVATILIVFIAGVGQIDAANYNPFTPFGVRGIFAGASIVFFSFIGFDTVSTAAEETKNPSFDLPVGIVGSLGICTILYVLMCLVITGMVPFSEIDTNAPFSAAFDAAGMSWVSRIVSLGAVAGITTSIMVSLLGQTRIYLVLAREGLLPPVFAQVHETRGTPVFATAVTAVTAGLLSFLFDIEILAELVSIGTLFVFACVCAAVLWRRYRVEERPALPLGWRLAAVVLLSVVIGEISRFDEPFWILAPLLLVLVGISYSLSRLPLAEHGPQKFKVPFVPYIPVMGIFSAIYLIGSLGILAYVRFVVWSGLSTVLYLLYGVHYSNIDAESEMVPIVDKRGMALSSRPLDDDLQNLD